MKGKLYNLTFASYNIKRKKRGKIMGTFVVGAIVLGCVMLAIRSLRADKRNGKASCGGGCGRCKGCH